MSDNGSTIGYAYNAANQRTDIVYPDGKTVTTAYDVMGNVTSLTDCDGSFIVYDRDAEGRVIKEAHSGGSTTEYDYNKAGQLVEQKEVAPDNATRRKILYGYDDAGNLTSENRTGVDFDRRDESVRYYYDRDNRLTSTAAEGKTTAYAYDLAGNLLSDGTSTYTYDIQNRLLTKTGASGTITYEYDAAGNLVKETNPDGTVSYTYNAQNKLVKGELSDGQSSTYTYNALGARIENEQVRANENRGYQNADLTDGSHGTDYLDFLRDGRATWQRAWESEIGTTHQNDYETVTRHYIVDYLSAANRDLIATEDGSYVTRYVYDENSVRISAEFDYADGTQRGEAGENLQSDFATERGKVWYRWSLLGSTLFAVDASGEVVAHAIYDAWGNPLTETYPDSNFSGLENTNNYTGYTYDETLDLYFAQNRFYAADLHRFTQEDIIKDGANWYVYCGNNPTGYVDVWGLTPTDDLWALDLSAIRSISVEGKTYYNLRDIYSAVGGTPFWSSYSSTASFTISTSIAGRHVKSLGITVQQGDSPRVLSDGTAVYQGNVIGSSDTDYFTDTISIYNRGGTNYVSYEELFSYFERVWCETGKQALSHAEVAAAVARYDLTERQVEALRKVNDYYRNYPELLNKATTVFAFEGVGAYRGEQWKNEYHPLGQFGAMMVVVQDGQVQYITKNASTLSDDPTDSSTYTVLEGIYNISNIAHKNNSSGYSALSISLNGGAVPSVHNGKLNTTDANGIHLHAAGTSANLSNTWSAGCVTVNTKDYVDFGKAVGFIPDSYLHNLQSIEAIKKNLPYYKNGKVNPETVESFSGKIIIDRSFMRNSSVLNAVYDKYFAY